MTTHAAVAEHHAADAAAPEYTQGMSRGMAGMVLFIASEIMLFGGLFAGYFYVVNQADTWPPESIEHTPGTELGAVLTLLLITSGLLGHAGIVALRSGTYGFVLPTGNRKGLILGIGLAIVLGSIFIGGQAYEWLKLFDEGLTAKSGVYGSTFFILTGFHGAHVIAGLAMLAVVFVRAVWGDFTPHRHLFADAAMLYWHFVDVVWVLLFVIIYLVNK
jgi:cytochrome c oxidase subunit 3